MPVQEVRVVGPDMRWTPILIESVILGAGVGYYLGTRVHPVAGIVGGLGTAVVYAFLYTRYASVARFVSVIVSVAWASLAVVVTRRAGGDVIWMVFVGVAVFGMSLFMHKAGIQQLKGD
jgi:hypothetical protein